MNIQNGDMSYTMTLDSSQFEKSIKNAIGDVHLMQNAVLGLVQGMAALASIEGIKAFASKAFEMRSFFQDAEAAMKVFLKSEDLAAEHLKELQSYAWYNVFEFTDLVSASRQLQAFGTEVEDVIPIIDKLSNIAAATNTPLENLVGIYNKAKVAGRLDSKGLWSLGNMGVNVKETLKEMGEQADVTSLSFEKFEKIIDHLTDKEAGGMFAGLMDEQFNNLSSLRGALDDSLDTLFADFGEDLQPMFETILKDAQAFVAWLDDHRDILESIAKTIITVTGAYGIYKGALALNVVYTKLAAKGAGVLGLSLEQIGKESMTAAAKVGLLTTASKALNTVLSASVWTALIAAVIKAGVEIYNVAKAQHSVADAAREATKDVVKEIETQRDEFNDLLNTLELAEEGTDKYARALEKLKKKYPDYLDNLNAEKLTIEEINAAREKGNKLLDLELTKKSTEAQKEVAISQRVEARSNAITKLAKQFEKYGLENAEPQKAAMELLKIAESANYKVNWGRSNYVIDKADLKKINDFIDGKGGKSFGITNKEIQNILADYRNIYDQSEDMLRSLGAMEEEILSDVENVNKSFTSSTIFTADPKKIANDIEEKQRQINEIRRNSTKKRNQILDDEGNVIKEYEYSFVGLTDKEQETIKSLEDDLKELNKQYETVTGSKYTSRITTELQRAKIAQQNAINAMADGYSKTVAEINSKYDSEIKQLEYQVNSVLVPGTEEHESAAQELQLKKNQRGNELSEAWKSFQANKAEAERLLDQIGTEEQRKIEDRQYALDALTISLMDEGSQKEIAQMQLNHSRRMTELSREESDAIAQLVDDDKKEWEARQKAKGLDPNDGDFWMQYKGPNQVAVKAIQEYYDKLSKGQEDSFAKQQDDFWSQMLAKYGDYTAQKEAIDRKYYDEVSVFEKQLAQAQIAGDYDMVDRLKNVIEDVNKAKAKETFNLDMNTIDATAYATVDEKMAAINKAYEEYIQNLIKAGASQAEIDAALQEQVELTGKVATINAQIAGLEGKKVMAVESGDTDEVKRLNEEILKLKNQLQDMENTSNKKTFGTMFKEWAKELKASDIIGASGELGDVIANIGEAAENKAIAGFGQALSFAGDIGAKIASGDYLGAALSIITEIGNAIAEDIAKVNAFKKANEQAAQTANQINIDNLLGGEDGIFGKDTVSQLANFIEAADKARKSIGELGVNASHSFKVLDRSAFANFFGGDDKFSTLGDFARNNGMDLYDAYGNINAQVLDLFKNTYEDLTEADKQWIDNAIAYTDQYEEAMEGLASYLETIFGNTVDTIVDQLFEGAIDMKAIVADVGEAMAKDLMKSAIMSSYFGDLKEQMTEILKAEGGMTDRAAAEIYGMYSEAMARFENDLPTWQAMAEQYKDAFDFGEAPSIRPGTALSSTSQESIDLMNGQLNAMRTVQGRIDGTINNILLEMRGFRGDMNANHGETLQQLQQINTNTSERGLGRALGAYFG